MAMTRPTRKRGREEFNQTVHTDGWHLHQRPASQINRETDRGNDENRSPAPGRHAGRLGDLFAQRVGWRWQAFRSCGISMRVSDSSNGNNFEKAEKGGARACACIILAGLLKLPPECDSNPPCALSPIPPGAMRCNSESRGSAQHLF